MLKKLLVLDNWMLRLDTVRKLEFIFADALQHGCDTVLTCGGMQSNHCRAVAGVAAQLGMDCHLLLRSSLQSVRTMELQGNLLLDNLTGAKCYLVGPKEPYKTHLLPRMQKLASNLRERHGKRPYIIPVGGSDSIGLFGYIAAFNEIILDPPKDLRNIFVACGSGGTLAGLAVANHLAGSKYRIYGISVCDNADYFYDHVQQMLSHIGLKKVLATDICHVIDGYKGLGYGLSTESERELIHEIASRTGIYLDPVYTGKACGGMLAELTAASDTYEGNSLFIHTGGIFGIFGENSFRTIESVNNETVVSEEFLQKKLKICLWKNPDDAPYNFLE